MGYESKILVVRRTESYGNFVFGDEIARFELCKMPYYEQVNGKGFHDLFKKPIDFSLYNVKYIDENQPDIDPEEWMTDCYGEHCKSAPICEVYDWLRNWDGCEEYFRAAIFRDFLKNLLDHVDQTAGIMLVHFGH